jgi:hypothetical protein
LKFSLLIPVEILSSHSFQRWNSLFWYLSILKLSLMITFHFEIFSYHSFPLRNPLFWYLSVLKFSLMIHSKLKFSLMILSIWISLLITFNAKILSSDTFLLQNYLFWHLSKIKLSFLIPFHFEILTSDPFSFETNRYGRQSQINGENNLIYVTVATDWCFLIQKI